MKVKVPVILRAEAFKFVGYVEIENFEDYYEAAERLVEEIDEDIMTNISNDFEVNDSSIQEVTAEHFESFKKTQYVK